MIWNKKYYLKNKAKILAKKKKTMDKWKEVINYCEKNNVTPNELLQICSSELYRKGEMSEFTNFRFELYAKKRIEQKNKNLHKQRGSKIKAVKEVIDSEEFKNEFNKIKKGRFFNAPQSENFLKLVCYKRQSLRLAAAFGRNGEKTII